MRVPVVNDDPAKVTAINLPFDRPKGDRPHEEYRVVDRALFDSFPERLATYTRSWGFEPLVNQIWPLIGAELDRGVTLGNRRVARAAVARTPVGRDKPRTARQPAGRNASVRRVLVHGAAAICPASSMPTTPRFATIAAATGCRARITRPRSCAAGAIGIEAPFWIWRADLANASDFMSGSSANELSFKPATGLSRSCRSAAPVRSDAWTEMSAAGWKVRPRALDPHPVRPPVPGRQLHPRHRRRQVRRGDRRHHPPVLSASIRPDTRWSPRRCGCRCRGSPRRQRRCTRPSAACAT